MMSKKGILKLLKYFEISSCVHFVMNFCLFFKACHRKLYDFAEKKRKKESERVIPQFSTQKKSAINAADISG